MFFSPDVNNQAGKFPYSLLEEELAWLERELSATDLPAAVFTHVPLLSGDMTGNYYFEGTRGRAEYLNAGRARAVVENSGKVLLVCAGHVHWNSLGTVNGVHYVTLQALSESFTTHPEPAGAYATVEVGEALSIRVFGADPLSLELPRRCPGRAWLRR